MADIILLLCLATGWCAWSWRTASDSTGNWELYCCIKSRWGQL